MVRAAKNMEKQLYDVLITDRFDSTKGGVTYHGLNFDQVCELICVDKNSEDAKHMIHELQQDDSFICKSGAEEIEITPIKTSKNILLNVSVLPEGDDTDYSIGIENRLYLNGVYLARYQQEDEDYTMTSEAFLDLIEGLKMALCGLTYKEEIFDDARLQEIFGDEAYLTDSNGAAFFAGWDKIEELLGVQVVGQAM